MTDAQTSAPMWLTSRESSSWHEPRVVQVEDTGSGPNPDRTYALIRVQPADSSQPAQRLVVADRFEPGWAPPEPARPREVAVWQPDGPGATWGEHGLTVADPAPQFWCTLCATQGEAEDIAADMRRQMQRAGW